MQVLGDVSVIAHTVTLWKKRQKLFWCRGFIFGIQYQGSRGKYCLY